MNLSLVVRECWWKPLPQQEHRMNEPRWCHLFSRTAVGPWLAFVDRLRIQKVGNNAPTFCLYPTSTAARLQPLVGTPCFWRTVFLVPYTRRGGDESMEDEVRSVQTADRFPTFRYAVHRVGLLSLLQGYQSVGFRSIPVEKQLKAVLQSPTTSNSFPQHSSTFTLQRVTATVFYNGVGALLSAGKRNLMSIDHRSAYATRCPCF